MKKKGYLKSPSGEECFQAEGTASAEALRQAEIWHSFLKKGKVVGVAKA